MDLSTPQGIPPRRLVVCIDCGATGQVREGEAHFHGNR